MNLIDVPHESKDAETPPHQWKDSSPVGDVFFVILHEGKRQIGQKILRGVRAFQGFMDEDDVLSEVQLRLWERLTSKPIKGVAELSADRQTVFFDRFGLIFCYARLIAKNLISNLHRNRKRSSFEKLQVPVDSIEIPMPVKSEHDQLRLRPPHEWLRCAQECATPDLQELLLLKLDGKADREIGSKLGIGLSSARKDRIRLEQSFRRNFPTRWDLLDAMQSCSLD